MMSEGNWAHEGVGSGVLGKRAFGQIPGHESKTKKNKKQTAQQSKRRIGRQKFGAPESKKRYHRPIPHRLLQLTVTGHKRKEKAWDNEVRQHSEKLGEVKKKWKRGGTEL